MSEDTKFIVSELNKVLGKNYNLISFNSLSPEDLLQVLSDVISEVQQQGGPKIDMRTENPEQSSIRLLSALRILNYQPNKDPMSFRQGLIKGDTEIIHDILKWLLSNMELVRKRTYLSRFLVKIDVPFEYLEDPDISLLYDQYSKLVEEFKMVHKEREAGKKAGEAAAEVKADLKAMEKEREIIMGRVEKMKMRAEPGLHLLSAAQALRLERDKEREIAMQKEQEKGAMSALQVSLHRAERELQNLKQASAGLTPQGLIQRLSEEITVLGVVANERLPSELTAKKAQVNALRKVVGSPHVGPDDIGALRNRLDLAARELQALVENKAAGSGADKMVPFRQQAAAVASMKRNTLDRLEKTEATLEELSIRLEHKRDEARRLAEEPAPKGDELKRYVARLKARSALYKRCRSELAGLKAESGVLHRTLAILENQMSQIKPSNESPSVRSVSVLPDDCTVESASLINTQLSRNISTFRAQLAPLLNELRPLRQKSEELDERYERAHRSHSSVDANMETTMNNLCSEVEGLRRNINESTTQAERLSEEVAKLKLAEDRIQQEIRTYASPGGGSTLRDELQESIQKEEKKLKVLKEEEQHVKEHATQYENQTQQWSNLISIFECKLQCAEENKRRDGIVVRGQGAERLILQ
ncbi:intraflagellar transport protein 81 homolog [Orussus abietinus]|uniref:intraflagellar transport protein 81 homolog n=1 Tax=Orussus abietinus TaxID=222816 RepID=UPI00062509EC|nr:intraflagellar transport protein 81 homolog [Orussus abietinus]